jgi:hypothetical protein
MDLESVVSGCPRLSRLLGSRGRAQLASSNSDSYALSRGPAPTTTPGADCRNRVSYSEMVALGITSLSVEKVLDVTDVIAVLQFRHQGIIISSLF